MEEHMRVVGPMNGKFTFQKRPDGTIDKVLPAFRHLDHVMDITDNDPAYVVKFNNAFQKDLAAWRADTNETWFKVATALDPHFRDLKCLPREKREQVSGGI
ncbi:hypothetical protein L3Q82_004067 [Scortum barcoo]|uniref:Uncharacterized protein n=1 Tax=Scortum barcoo TaxID=214431 RepID=A0ACB8X7C0_9TELE|nr:hypothetical protein L3Q82_004067 [Scortum barcoo]